MPFAEKDRAKVIAGLAKLVETVEKYAEPIHAGTRYAIALLRPCSMDKRMMSNKTAVAINSPRKLALVARLIVDKTATSLVNIRLARIVPETPPMNCALKYENESWNLIFLLRVKIMVTTGLK